MDNRTLTADEIAHSLDQLRRLYELGQKDASLEAISLCAHYNLLMPIWVRSAFIEQFDSARFYEADGWDDVFGPSRRKGRLKDLQLNIRFLEVYDRVMEHVDRGGSRNEEFWVELGEDMGIGATKLKKLWAVGCELHNVAKEGV